MTNMTVLDVAAATAATSGSATAAQPSAQAVSRFEQQLYGAPLGESGGAQGTWQSVVGNVGQISQQFRIDSMALGAAPPTDQMSPGSPAGLNTDSTLEGFRQSMSQVTHMSYTMLSVNLVTSAERVAGENVRTLFQLS